MTINGLNFDAQALREKILDLAMRGKLVKQDPNDEPASVLVEKIKAEKERLVKEKKIKKTKPLPPITDEEKPFDIPDSWEWVRLGDVSIPLQYGFTDSAASYGNSKFLRITDIQNGKVNWKNVPWCTISNDKLERLKLKNKDILVARTGGTVGKSFVVNNLQETAVFASYLIRIRLLKISALYGKTVLNSPYYWNYISDKKSGTGQPNVNASKLSELLIPLPPLNEQRRIADKIAQLFALLRKVESSNDQYIELQKMLHDKVLDLAMRGKLVEQNPNDEPASVLLEKIKAEKAQLVKEKKIKKSKPLPPITDEEKPFKIPDSWEWVRLGDLVAPVEYSMADGPFGSNLKKSDYTDKQEVRIIQLSNIGMNGWKNENKKYTTFKHLKEIERSEVYPGNIVIAKMMPAGRAIVVPNKDPKYVLSSDAVKFIPNKNVNIQFVLKAINSDVYRNQVNSKLQGSTRPRTSLKKLKNFIIPLPPFREQERIVNKIKLLNV